MSKRYPGGLITKNPNINPTPEGGASGIWTLDQAILYQQLGTWPSALDPYFNQTTLLLHGDGTNGAQNNTFLDSSTNNFTITRNGNTTQGTFSPFSLPNGEWSNYFDGTANGSLRANSSTDTDLSGDFTVQAWVCPTANSQASNSEIISRGAATTLNGWRLGLVTSTTRPFFGINYAGTGATVYTASSTNIPLNQWTHLAVTRSGNTVVIYINGVADTTNTGFTGTPTVSGTEYVYVGRGSYSTTNRQFTGYVSNASIIKGTALTTFNTTTPLATGTSGQSLLTCTANRFVDANTATTAKALTVGSGASVQPFSPFAPSAAYSASVNGGSGYFDGTGDTISFTDASNDLDMGGLVASLDVWFYPTQNNAFGHFFGKHGGSWSWSTSNGIEYALAFNSGQFYLVYNSSGGPAFVTDPTSGRPLNQWYWVVVATDASNNIALFINGVRVATGSNAITKPTTRTSILIGGDAVGTGLIGGYLSGHRFISGGSAYDPTDTTLTVPTAPPDPTSTELCLAYTNAGIFDNTGKNNLETVGNAQIDTTTVKYGTGSMEFDGTGDYLSAPMTPNLAFGTGDMTIECWVYANTISGIDTIFDTRTSGSFGNESFLLQLNAGVPQMWAGSYSGASPVAAGSAAISTSTWTHIAFTRSSGTNNLFVDGVSVASNSTAWNQTLVTTNPYYIGQTVGVDRPFDGYIDDLRITKGVARYTANFTPPGGPFQNS